MWCRFEMRKSTSIFVFFLNESAMADVIALDINEINKVHGKAQAQVFAFSWSTLNKKEESDQDSENGTKNS